MWEAGCRGNMTSQIARDRQRKRPVDKDESNIFRSVSFDCWQAQCDGACGYWTWSCERICSLNLGSGAVCRSSRKGFSGSMSASNQDEKSMGVTNFCGVPKPLAPWDFLYFFTDPCFQPGLPAWCKFWSLCKGLNPSVSYGRWRCQTFSWLTFKIK